MTEAQPSKGGSNEAPFSDADGPGSVRLAGTTVLFVDDDPLLSRASARLLSGKGVQMALAESGEQALAMMAERAFGVMITDFRMPGMDGVELCRRVRRLWPETVCVLLSGHTEYQVAASAINRGGVFRILTKPCDPDDLRDTVADAMEQYRIVHEHREFERLLGERNRLLLDLNERLDNAVAKRTTALFHGLINALDLRDTETQGHSRRVALYARRLAEQLGLEPEQVLDVERGALLHDIGKIGVSDTILLKPGKLTEEEWGEMRKHSLYGYEILAGIDFLTSARLVVRSHHERFDGKGYPDGLQGSSIPLGARIFAVIDTYDAMTSDRPYRRALPAEVARAEIEKQTGSQFDPDCSRAFLAVPQDDIEQARALVSTNQRAGLD